MKNLKFKFVAFLIVLACISAACSVDDNDNYCYFQSYTNPTGVTGPTTTTVNTPITLNVAFIPLGTCGKFNRFAEATTTSPKEIRILLDYEGCSCPPTTKESTAPYTFTATTAGEYELRFVAADPTKMIVRKITVTE
ncbi:hypothetical protein R1T16_16040 [Flavobacterium sp. DG1-102-2]|uniref:hypothetical protein n=1 Tax=Flavobacterium sp. DG1-102-2 TaxID=3081663 RepID=UPI00294A386C|nr:hypothetical protein [Flavobacterium sp. DG1-102-2]MDV6169949.1 hypothetical protein [Flavobacterium sp. DG1-102-2]